MSGLTHLAALWVICGGGGTGRCSEVVLKQRNSLDTFFCECQGFGGGISCILLVLRVQPRG